ncbi:MAG: hypothetical protein MJA84_07280, partial [Firmicutes bacterium]|nr:hypothetical protein [Bacillota bacterium]
RYVQNREQIQTAPEWKVKLLEKLMASLTEREKDAYQLVRGQGYSFAQAAQIMKCKKGAAQSYIRRAEKKIQLALRKQVISEGVI